MAFFIFRDNVELGPLELSELENMLRDGKVMPETLVRRDTSGTWCKFCDLLKREAGKSPLTGTVRSDNGKEVSFLCPYCKQAYASEDRTLSGQTAVCTGCQKEFIIPDLALPKAPDEVLPDQLIDAEIGQSEDGSILCPHCWKSFDPDKMLYLSVHPSLFGDPMLGEFEPTRFSPTVYNTLGQPLDARGLAATETACPRCHLRIPSSFIDLPSHCFSIAGAISSGKSYFLTCMIHRLRTSLPQKFGATFSDLDPRLNDTLNHYEKQLFMSLEPDKVTALPATQISGDGISDKVLMNQVEIELPKPFCFEFRPENGEKSENLIFYDNSGEMFTPGRDEWVNQATFHLGHSSGIMFLFDPSNDATMLHQVCDPADPQVSEKPRVVDQNILLSEMISRIKRHTNVTGAGECEIPLIVVVGKYDLWRNKIDRDLEKISPFSSNVEGRFAVDLNAIADVSFAVREFMMQYAPEFVSTAESFFKSVYFVPVSNFGGHAKMGDDGMIGVVPGAIRSIWVDVPLLLLLANLELIDVDRKHKQLAATGVLSAKIENQRIVFRHPQTGIATRLPLNYAGLQIGINGMYYTLPAVANTDVRKVDNIWA